MNITVSQFVGEQELLENVLRQEAHWRDRLSSMLAQHHAALLARCYGYLKNREDAEDAVQETELRAFRSIHGFRGDCAFRTWLFAIADRQCWNLASRRSRYILDENMYDQMPSPDDGCDRALEASEIQAVVARTLKTMPQNARDILILRFYKELSLADIAATLGLGLSATKMGLYRALDQLSAKLPVELLSLYA
jgi:RNA polymerase sigma-70 factor (ECF subfamily)